MPARLGSTFAPWSPVTAFGHPSEVALRLVPVAVAALLFFAAGAIAEAPFEIAALAPPWTAALLGLCLASRSIVAPLFAACFAPLAVAALAPGSRWTAVQAIAIIAAFEVARGWARRFRAGNVLPTAGEFFGVALALHATLATRLLVPWESTPRQVLLLFGPPAIAALAAVRIARRRAPSSNPSERGDGSGGGMLVALVALATIGPGFTTPLLLTLVAFAAVTEFEAARSVETPILRRALALALLILPCFFETRIGLLAAAAALAWVWPSWIARLALPAGLALAAVAMRLREPADVVTQLAWLPALVPGLWFVARRDRGLALTALLLGFAGLLALPDQSSTLATLAPALALLLLAATQDNQQRRTERLQGPWSLGAFALAALVAGFPWLATDPLETVRRGLELPAGPFGWHSRHVSRDDLADRKLERSGKPLEAVVAIEGVEPIEAAAAPEPGSSTDDGTVLARLVVEQSVAQVAVVSQMANAAQLPSGTTVAVLRARGADGQRVSFPLRAGLETGEWAARRENVAAPEPWRSFLAPIPSPSGSSRCEIGAIYRARFATPPLAAPVTLEVVRARALPAQTILEVRGLEWRP